MGWSRVPWPKIIVICFREVSDPFSAFPFYLLQGVFVVPVSGEKKKKKNFVSGLDGSYLLLAVVNYDSGCPHSVQPVFPSLFN